MVTYIYINIYIFCEYWNVFWLMVHDNFLVSSEYAEFDNYGQPLHCRPHIMARLVSSEESSAATLMIFEEGYCVSLLYSGNVLPLVLSQFYDGNSESCNISYWKVQETIMLDTKQLACIFSYKIQIFVDIPYKVYIYITKKHQFTFVCSVIKMASYTIYTMFQSVPGNRCLTFLDKFC